MMKTSVIVDKDIVDQAAAILGTNTLRDTIDASLHEVVNARKRLELIELLSDTTRFDFSVIDRAWGGHE
jgi:Arc/MetJ family transcription regulator